MSATAPFIAPFLFGPPPTPPRTYDLEREIEFADLQVQDEEISAYIEELSGFRVGSLAWKKTHREREELVVERRRIRDRMLAIARD